MLTMGLAIGAAKMLMKESLRRPLAGRVLTLGRQFVVFPYEELVVAAREFGVALRPVRTVTLHSLPALAAKGYLSDDSLFELLGFEGFESLDYSDYEQAHITFDMNEKEAPEGLKEKYDFIIDSGTMEHVFHVPNFLANIHAMLRPGGRVVHLSPASNYIEHGFYCFSPSFFADYYTANNYEINQMQMVKHVPAPEVPWEISDYTPGCLEPVSFGGLDDGMYLTLCIVTKTSGSTAGVVPQQGHYRAEWARAQQGTPPAPAPAPELPSVASMAPAPKARLKKFIKDRPLIYQPLRRLRHLINPPPPVVPPKKGLGLEVVARY
jgi:hypothetical protein